MGCVYPLFNNISIYQGIKYLRQSVRPNQSCQGTGGHLALRVHIKWQRQSRSVHGLYANGNPEVNNFRYTEENLNDFEGV